jgi:ribosomal protein S18 acetylase RimI-like enzyme
MGINESPTRPQAGAITITVAQPEDIPALQATAAASWWATYGALLSASFIESFLARAYSSDRLALHLTDPSSHFLVVKTGVALIGFGQVGPTMPRRDTAPVAPADLYRLYLLPQWQRRGIGARLLMALETWLRDQEYPYYGAYVHERNEPAKHFYQRQGFAHKRECDVQDEWYLVKWLDG